MSTKNPTKIVYKVSGVYCNFSGTMTKFDLLLYRRRFGVSGIEFNVEVTSKSLHYT